VRALPFAALAAVVLAPCAGAADVAFAIPDGWVEVGPGTPPERLRGAPEAFVQVARSSKYALAAIDLEHPFEGGFSHMLVQTFPRDELIFEGRLSQFAESLVADARRAGMEAWLRSADAIDVGGVRCARVVFDAGRPGSVTTTVLRYFMPAGDRIAVQSFYLHRDTFEARHAALDAAALRARGLSEATGASGSTASIPRFGAVELGGMFGKLLGAFGFVGAISWLLRRRWRRAVGPAFLAGFASCIVHEMGSARPPAPMAEWDPALFVLASATWWMLFRRRDARATQRAPSTASP
jgi:hypothetical protein